MSNGISIAESQQQASAEIAAREQDVARADSEFSTSIQQASQAGKATVMHAVSMLRPVLIGAAVLAGGALVVSLLRGRTARVGLFSQYQEPSPWPALARAAVLALASSAGRRLADRWLAETKKAHSGSIRPVWAPSGPSETPR